MPKNFIDKNPMFASNAQSPQGNVFVSPYRIKDSLVFSCQIFIGVYIGCDRYGAGNRY